MHKRAAQTYERIIWSEGPTKTGLVIRLAHYQDISHAPTSQNFGVTFVSMADTTVNVRHSRKRRITEKRRQQGREAQRRYRDKQRASQSNAGDSNISTNSGVGTARLEELPGCCSNDASDQILATSADLQSSMGVTAMGGSSLEAYSEPEILASTQSILPIGRNANAVGHLAAGSTLQIPMDTYVHVRRYSFYAACIANAAVLGVPFSRIQQHSCGGNPLPSPWIHQTSDVTVGELTTATDLIAGEAQRRYEHDLYIDCLPFRDFRERLLALRSVEPKVFDEADFIRDLDDRDAFQCWGPTPWENRSWEVQPWFLQKWWMITGGEHGEMAISSRWWRMFRGDT